MYKMSMIVRYSRIFSDRKLKKYDMNFGEEVIVMYLAANSGINQEAIAKHFMIDKGAIAKSINRLEEKQYIIKKQNPDNKRENLLWLSEKGMEIIEEMKGILEEWNALLYKDMTEEEVETVNRLIDRIADNVIEEMR